MYLLAGQSNAVGCSEIGNAYTQTFENIWYAGEIERKVTLKQMDGENGEGNEPQYEITAAQSLVNTYSEILNNRTTLERVIEKSKVDYSYAQLAGMIKSQPSNETEIMVVTVTTENPYESAKIANTIAEVLPIRISEIIDGASMEVVDSAVPVLNKVSPSVTKYTALGMILGILISVAIITIIAIMDDTIRDEEYIIQNYKYPILAKVPDLLDSTPGRYGYYYKQSRKPKN
jgi:capsular polysaccharide biosynthesis protein